MADVLMVSSTAASERRIHEIQIDVVAVNGSQSFSPNPSAIPPDGSGSITGNAACTRASFIPAYAHLDCFIGSDASGDVFSLVVLELDRLN